LLTPGEGGVGGRGGEGEGESREEEGESLHCVDANELVVWNGLEKDCDIVVMVEEEGFIACSRSLYT
jgi:hypothetical protein